MSISNDQLQRAVSAARVRESQGYFGRVKAGDQTAASLFVRLVADDLNPSGKPTDYGWLSKSPGESQVDGYAEDAICFGADPSDTQNVVDLVNGAGAPGASIGGAVKERRAHNIWVKPQPLQVAELSYLLEGGAPMPLPPPVIIMPAVPARDEALDELLWLDSYYSAPEGLIRSGGLSIGGRPDFEGVAAWYLDVYQQQRMRGKTRAEARAEVVKNIRSSAEWQIKHHGETP